jgi:hypothetical protein
MLKSRRARHWALGAGLAVAAVVPAALSLFPARSDAACCYFAAQDKDINQPGQKAFIAWDAARKLEAFTVQPKFEGNAMDFGMVIPTPGQPKLDEMPRDFFKDLAIYTILMPLPEPLYGYAKLKELEKRMDGARPGAGGADDRNGSVKVLEAGVVGSLDYKIIVADKADALFEWLKENEYVYSGDQGTLDFYIQKKWFFTVMKIDPKQMKKNADGSYLGEVTPTRFTFATDKCIYPLKITQISVKDQTDALFYVQSAGQMDLEGDLSWMHSYRVMWLTYMLGCGANADQQSELEERTRWVEAKKKKDPKYETTKLEWAKKLGESELAVVEDPLKNYAQMGGGDLPAGYKAISFEEFLKLTKAEWEKAGRTNEAEFQAWAKGEEVTHGPAKGMIVKVENPQGAWSADYMWYANREAPAEEVKGLARLKGHLSGGQWLTKFRKIIRKDEMTDDLVLVPVPAGKEQEYVRIMPTSPP